MTEYQTHMNPMTGEILLTRGDKPVSIEEAFNSIEGKPPAVFHYKQGRIERIEKELRAHEKRREDSQEKSTFRLYSDEYDEFMNHD